MKSIVFKLKLKYIQERPTMLHSLGQLKKKKNNNNLFVWIKAELKVKMS